MSSYLNESISWADNLAWRINPFHLRSMLQNERNSTQLKPAREQRGIGVTRDCDSEHNIVASVDHRLYPQTLRHTDCLDAAS